MWSFIQKCLETILIPFIRLMLRVFFREIEVVGTQRVPADTPVIYTPNHLNSVLDGLLARVFLPRDPRTLAKATLWEITAIRPFLVAVNAIPVYRQQDASHPEYANRNQDMFAACYDALADNETIVLFPEGQSHSESELQPLKTGAARIALGAARRHPDLGLRFLPVGINFDAKQQFRSRVLITIGEPIDPLIGVAAPNPEDRDAVMAVTERLEEGIKTVTLNYPTWEEANVMGRAAEIYVSRRASDPEQARLADEFPLHKQLSVRRRHRQAIV